MNRLLFLSVLLLLPSVVSAQNTAPKATHYRVYLGTYTGKMSKGVYQLELDLQDGKMSMPTLAVETKNPSFVAIHPNQKFLYTVGEGGKDSGVSAFAIDAKTGGLTLLNAQPPGGSGPCHLVVDAAGKNVLVANYGSGSCCCIPIQPDGKLAAPSSVLQHKGKGVLPNQEGPHAHSFNLDKANQFAFCADLGLDKVFVYRFDAAKGALTANEPAALDLKPGTGPRHFAFHPDGKHAYVNGEMAMTITACDYDAAKGVLTTTQTVTTLPQDEKRKKGSTAEVVVHPSGKFVYVSNRDPYNSIAIFAIDPKTRALTAVGHEARGIKTPRNFAIEPTGQYLLVANQSGNNVLSFRIDQQTGALTPTGSRVEVGAPVCVRFMPLAK